MNVLKDLLRIYFGRPYAIESYNLPGLASVEGNRWRLTEAGEELIQPELSRMAAVMFPNDRLR